MSISTPEEINMLLNFFLPYAYCVICAEPEPTISESLSDITYSSCECPVDEKERKLIDSVKKAIEGNAKNNEEQDNNKIVQTDSLNSESASVEGTIYYY
jgi:hypothetical protein